MGVNITTRTTIMIAEMGHTLKASKPIPGWTDANILTIRFTLNNERGRGTKVNRDDTAALTDIASKPTGTLIVDSEACMNIVATTEREYIGGERPAHQTRTIELPTITKFRWRVCESNSSG